MREPLSLPGRGRDRRRKAWEGEGGSSRAASGSSAAAGAGPHLPIAEAMGPLLSPRGLKGRGSGGGSDGEALRQLLAHDRGAGAERLQLAEGGVAGEVFHAAIGGRDEPVGGDVGEGGADAGGDRRRRLDRAV